ncbi:hypothetical protein HDV00_004929 [Rhizophlyctis rosea]|nr:hypothetical protein HDV00_004929 [Rhizophlyctis rosea]
MSNAPPKSLFVRGLTSGTRAEDLLAAFKSYGNVKDVYLPRDYYTGKARGFAYIQYETQQEAELAFEKIEYITVNGEDLKLEWAAGNRKRPEQMRARDERTGRAEKDREDRYYRPRISCAIPSNKQDPYQEVAADPEAATTKGDPAKMGTGGGIGPTRRPNLVRGQGPRRPTAVVIIGTTGQGPGRIRPTITAVTEASSSRCSFAAGI